jgi:hypothetical protein
MYRTGGAYYVLYMALLISNDKFLELLMYYCQVCDVLFVKISQVSVSQDRMKTSGLSVSQDRFRDLWCYHYLFYFVDKRDNW